jgi:hypothetical protein
MEVQILDYPWEEERIRVVQDGPELLLSWIPGTLSPNEEREI